jgi:hypothetical protein
MGRRFALRFRIFAFARSPGDRIGRRTIMFMLLIAALALIWNLLDQ